MESARSHALSLEAENLKLKKELIATMNDANLAKEKLRTLTEELRVERELTKEKDEQLAVARERAKGLLEDRGVQYCTFQLVLQGV